MSATDDIELIDKNKELADFLDLLAGYYVMDKSNPSNAYRAKTFTNASTQIRNHPTAIVTGFQARQELSRIGEGTEQEINEFLSTGSSQRLREVEARFAERKAIIDYFRSFHGIGPVKAMEYYNREFRTWEDLWVKAPITDATRIAIYWQNHLKLRIERSEMDLINARIASILNPYGIKWSIAGSYRRGEPSSGDIDILIESRPDLDMFGMAYLLKDLIPIVNINGVDRPSILSQGPLVMMGVLRLDEQHKAHRFDVKFIKPLSYSYALMHFTGSVTYNVLMRRRAIEIGLTLNEYILYRKSGSTYIIYPASNEMDICQWLGVQYLEPFERTRALTHLTSGYQRTTGEIVVDITQPITNPELSELIERLERIESRRR